MAEWNGTREADSRAPGRWQVPPSLPRYPTDNPLTYTAGVHSGSSSDSPSLDHRTRAVNSHPSHSGAPLPGAGQADFEGTQRHRDTAGFSLFREAHS